MVVLVLFCGFCLVKERDGTENGGSFNFFVERKHNTIGKKS